MTLVRTGLLNALAVFVKMLTLLGINKILAVYVGPGGYALIGQLQNLVSMILTFTGGAVNTGVTKYTAEYVNDVDKKHLVWGTAFRITVIMSLLISAFLFVYSSELSLYFLKNADYKIVFNVFSIVLIFFSWNALILAVLNGQKEIGKYVTINILGSLVSLSVAAVLTICFGLKGALIAFVSQQSIVFFVSYIAIRKTAWCKLSEFVTKFSRYFSLKLFGYALIGVSSAVSIPISHMLVRNYIGTNIGWGSAGYWDAMWKISSIYLLFVTSILGVYFLPKFSELNSVKKIHLEILNGYKIILPLVIFIAIVIFYLREFLILTLFTEQFLNMQELFLWQLVGDVFKIASWILGVVLLAKEKIRLVVVSEIFFALNFYLLTVYFCNFYGLVGVTYAHVLNYLIHFIFMLIIISKGKF